MVNSNQKGKRGEREVAALLRKYGFEARRGQQFSGSPDSPDVVSSLPGAHIEVKFVERFSLYSALDQAQRDSSDKAMIFHRRKNRKWVIVMYADDFFSETTEQCLSMANFMRNEE